MVRSRYQVAFQGCVHLLKIVAAAGGWWLPETCEHVPLGWIQQSAMEVTKVEFLIVGINAVARIESRAITEWRSVFAVSLQIRESGADLLQFLQLIQRTSVGWSGDGPR